MAYQSQVHFWLLFFLLSAHLLFDRAQRAGRLLTGCAAAALSIFSVAAGAVSALPLLGAFGLFKALRARGAADAGERRRELLQLLLVLSLVGGALGLWAAGYRKPPGGPLSSPLGAAFWDHFLNVLAFSFGVDSVSWAAGLVVLVAVLAPVCLQIFFERGRCPPGSGPSSRRW